MEFGIWYLNVTDMRKAALAAYIEQLYGKCELQSLSGDASLRRYFRFPFGIAVDAPPASQKNQEFVVIDEALSKAGLCVPKIYHSDLQQGFMVLEDLGDKTFQSALNSYSMEYLYFKACDLLMPMSAVKVDLLNFDINFIDTELGIFKEWMLEKTLHLSLNENDLIKLSNCFDYIKSRIQSYEQIPMHRDFHCRNLMIYKNNLYIIDFQDMLKGPIGYDLASLVYDCYLNLPEDLITKIINRAYLGYRERGYLQGISETEFKQQLNIISLERHLKVLGIFRRLYMRDGKDSYLQHLPRVLAYAQKESLCDPNLFYLSLFLDKYFKDI